MTGLLRRRVLHGTLATVAFALIGCAAAPAAPAPESATRSASVSFPLINLGFESAKRQTGGDPEGWLSFQHAGDVSYRFTLDANEKKSGQQSLRIDNTGIEPYGVLQQFVNAVPHGGKIARLSGWIKTKDASDHGAGLTINVSRSGYSVGQNYMADAPIKGTTNWTRYEITVPVPAGASRVEVGVMLRGKGSVWFDDAELEFITP